MNDAAQIGAAFTPAPEIIAELQASPLPLEAKAAMLSFTNELGPGPWQYSWSPFRCLFGFTQWTGSLAAFPQWPGVKVDGKPTHAFDPWQDEPETYDEIVALTGNPGCEPQDQIANNWVLAVRDFGSRTGGADLLTALKAGALTQVSAALIATWPAGADQGFGDRYTQALALFAAAPAPPAVPPPPPPPSPLPPSPADAVTLRLGTQVSFPIAGTDQDGQPYTLAPDALVSDNPKVCTTLITTPADGAVATITSVGLGQTLVHDADLAITVTVEASRLVHLTANLAKAVVSRIPTVMAMAVALGLMMMPAGDHSGLTPVQPAAMSISVPSKTAKSYAALGPHAAPQIGDPDFCLGSGSLIAMERCLAWTAAFLRR